MKKLLISLACITLCALTAFIFLYGPVSQRNLHYSSLPGLVNITHAQVCLKEGRPVISVTFLNSSDWRIDTVTESGEHGAVPTFSIGEHTFPLPGFVTQKPAEFAGIPCTFTTPIFKNAEEVRAALAAGGALRVEIPVREWSAQSWPCRLGRQTYSADGAPYVVLRYPSAAPEPPQADE